MVFFFVLVVNCPGQNTCLCGKLWLLLSNCDFKLDSGKFCELLCQILCLLTFILNSLISYDLKNQFPSSVSKMPLSEMSSNQQEFLFLRMIFWMYFKAWLQFQFVASISFT